MRLIFTIKSLKQLEGLPSKECQKIKRKVILLKSDPFAGKSLGGKLARYYSLRAWPYRIIYWVDKENKEVWVASILHRQRAYK